MPREFEDRRQRPDAVPEPDPNAVQTPAELAAALDALRTARGLTYTGLEKAALPDSLSPSTISDLLRKGRPSQETLEVFLRACGLPRERHRAWLAARERAVAAVPPGGANGVVRVAQAKARALGVHKPIAVAGASGEMPVYVERDTDTAAGGVRDLLRRAMRDGGMVVLVGGSSSGKTRCAFEAVRAVMPQWWLAHPSGPAQVAELSLESPSRTVVWLDELQNHLNGERGLTAAVVRRLIGAGAVLVGTLWPEYYTAYTRLPEPGAADVFRVEREVLKRAEIVHIDAVFSPGERERAARAARHDPRIALAVESKDYGITQVIAAAPLLVDRWHAAGPYARAVLCAAVDAARLGARAPLSADLLRAAAPGYCDARERAAAPPHWFETALAYATEPVHGVAAALAPVAAEMGGPAGYVLAGYLLQYAGGLRRTAKAPAGLWQALVGHVTDPADQIRLAGSATDRLLYRYAEPLYRKAEQAGDGTARRWLAEMLARQGRREELRARADAGDTFASVELAELSVDPGWEDEWDTWDEDGDGLGRPGRRAFPLRGEITAEALVALRARAEAGDGSAAWRLARLLESQGRLDEAVAILRARVEAGDVFARPWLTDLLIEQGRVDEALEVLRARVDGGDMSACRRLAELLAGQGRVDEALAMLRARIEAGDHVDTHLVDLLAEHGRVEELRARAEAGDGHAVKRLADLLTERGQADEASAVLRARAETDHVFGGWWLADLLAGQGRMDELRAQADAGNASAAKRLADLLAEQGRAAELRARTEAGDRYAARVLATALAQGGRTAEAEHVRRFGLPLDR
jgi:predicted negative regulator of RcsB-dependent stress response